MKILFVIDSLTSGGAQRQLIELAKAFKEEGSDVSFLTYHQDNYYLNELVRNNIPHVCIEEPNYIKRLLKMRNYIRMGSYTGVIAFLEASSFICEFAGLPSRSWKLIVGERSAKPEIYSSFKLKAYRWFHFLADYVVANSESNLNMIRRINPFLSSKKHVKIYNILDLEYWRPDPQHLFRRDGRLHLVIPASHQYLKNLIGLVEAVNLLEPSEKIQLKVNWYGRAGMDNSKEDALKKIKEYNLQNIFTFFEATTQIKDIMTEADIVGLFSFYEGLPNAICEGMAVGKPIIASDVSDNAKLIHHGESGFICEPTNPVSIRNEIRKALRLTKEEAQKMGAINRGRALDLFEKEQNF